MDTQRKGGFLIAKIHFLAGRIFARLLREKQIEINPSQGRIMFALWMDDGISISELVKRTALEKSTLTNMLLRLENMGYIKRQESPADRRKLLIYLTEKDAAWQETYIKVSHAMSALFYRGFSESEIDEFESYLSRLFINLTSDDEYPASIKSS